jgi:hypothetical protein
VNSTLREMLEHKGGVFLDFETFALMKKALTETFASGASVIIATMAKPCGRKICKEIMQKTKSKEEALKQFCLLVNEQNWGTLSFLDVDFDKGTGRAIVRNSFETRSTSSNSEGNIFQIHNF